MLVRVLARGGRSWPNPAYRVIFSVRAGAADLIFRKRTLTEKETRHPKEQCLTRLSYALTGAQSRHSGLRKKVRPLRLDAAHGKGTSKRASFSQLDVDSACPCSTRSGG